MPKGSAYPGAAEHLDRYRALIERHGDAELLGAKNPYTSRHGWMTSFLDPDGLICFRLSAEGRAAAIAAGGAEVQQYGRKMPDFAAAPSSASDGDLDALFAESWDHSGTLKPK